MSEETAITLKQDNPFMDMVRSLAANPDVPVDKLKQIMEMQEHIIDRNAEQAYNAAMVRAQRKMPVVNKDKKNEQTNSMYSGYETIVKMCAPIYTAEGFSLSFYEGKADRENEVRIFVDIMHEDGHTKQRYADIPIDSSGIKGTVNKTMTHAKGSTFSYGRSYLIRMVFNIPTGDDDDGNGAGSKYITDDQCNELNAMVSDNNLQLQVREFALYLKQAILPYHPIWRKADFFAHLDKADLIDLVSRRHLVGYPRLVLSVDAPLHRGGNVSAGRGDTRHAVSRDAVDDTHLRVGKLIDLLPLRWHERVEVGGRKLPASDAVPLLRPLGHGVDDHGASSLHRLM